MRLYYVPDYRKIITMYLLDKDYDLNRFTVASVLENELSKDNTILKLLHFIIEDKNDLRISNSSSVQTEKYLFQCTSIYDAIQANIPELNKLMIREFPYLLVKSLGGNKRNTIIDPQELTEKDIVNSIFLYEAMESVERFIRLNYDKKLATILPLTIRLYVPKEYICLMHGYFDSCLYYKTPLMINNHLVYEPLPDTDEDIAMMMKEKSIIDTELYHKTKNDSVVSSNTVYSMVFNMTISEWSRFINFFSDHEKNAVHPVVSAIPYVLDPFKATRSLLDVDMGKIKKIMEK